IAIGKGENPRRLAPVGHGFPTSAEHQSRQVKTVWIAGAALGLVLAILAVTAAVPQEREPSPTGPDEEPTTVRANFDSRDRSRMSVSHREFVDAALAWSMRRCRGVPVS